MAYVKRHCLYTSLPNFACLNKSKRQDLNSVENLFENVVFYFLVIIDQLEISLLAGIIGVLSKLYLSPQFKESKITICKNSCTGYAFKSTPVNA